MAIDWVLETDREKDVTRLHLMLKKNIQRVCPSHRHAHIVYILISVSLVFQGSVESLCE